jgi:hypothetical protein
MLILVSDGENEPLSYHKAFDRNASQQESHLRGWDVSDTSGTSKPKTVPYAFIQFPVEFICKNSCLVSMYPVRNIRCDGAQTRSKIWEMKCTL